MKKTYFKKSLSVIMAVLMIMSCWVFVPGEHNHAEAINYGDVADDNVSQVTGYVTIDPVIYTHGDYTAASYEGEDTNAYDYMMNGSVVSDGSYSGEFHTNVSVSGKTLSSITCVDTGATLNVQTLNVWNSETNTTSAESVLTGNLGGGYGSNTMDTKDSTATLKFAFSDGTYELRTLYVKTNPVAQHAITYAECWKGTFNTKVRVVNFEVLALGSYGQKATADTYTGKDNISQVANGAATASTFSATRDGNNNHGIYNFPKMYAPCDSIRDCYDEAKIDGLTENQITVDKVAGCFNAANPTSGQDNQKTAIKSPVANYYLDLSSSVNSGITHTAGTNDWSIKMFVGNLLNNKVKDAATVSVYEQPSTTVGTISANTGTFLNDGAFNANAASTGLSTISGTATAGSTVNGTYMISYKQTASNNPKSNIGRIYMPFQITVVDKSALRNVYNNYVGKKLQAKHYTKASWTAYSHALSEADAYLNNYEVSTANEATLKTNLETAYNNLVPRTFDISYENLFSFSEWAKTDCRKGNNRGTVTVDEQAGTVTLDGSGDFYTLYGGSAASYYTVPVTAGTEYTFRYDVTSTDGTKQAFVFFYDDDGNAITGATYNGVAQTNPHIGVYDGSPITFTVPTGCTRVGVRFGLTGTGKATFSNIAIYETARAKEVGLENWTNREYRKVFNYDEPLVTDYVPLRTGYTFQGWALRIGGSDFDFAGTNATATQSWTLYSTWTINQYTVKFVDKDNKTISETKYDYGTKASAITVPSTNSAMTKDATNHYTYTWPAVSDLGAADVTYKEVTTTTAHSWNDGVIDPDSTCTSTGTKTYICTVCGQTKTETVGIKAHTLTETKAKAAKCTEDGNIAYWTCSVCGKVFSDANGTTEITIEQTVISALNHSFTSGTYKNNGDGTHSQKCVRCDAYDAGVAHTESTAATCTTAAYCDVCKSNYGSANGHDFTSGTFKKVTDGENGTHQQKCKNCNEYDTATAHTWNAGVIAPESTCTSEGTKTFTCTATGCGAKYTESVGKKSHTLTKTDYKAPKCEETGNNEYWTCSVCGKVFSDANGTTETTVADMTIDALGHKFEGTVKSNGNGENATHSFKCTNAGCDKYGNPTAHSWNDGAETTPAECEKDGVMTFTCTVEGCGATYTKTIDATGHSFTAEKAEEKYLATDATCTEKAKYYKSCAACGLTSKGTADEATFESGNALEHEFAGTIKSYNDGTHNWKCTRCDVYGTTTDGADKTTNCDYNVIASSDGTCVTKAYKTYTCKDCGYGYTETFDFNPDVHEHTKDEAKQDATCTADGWEAGTYCNDCNTWVSGHDKINAIGHDYTGAIKNDGNGENGTHSYLCKNGCGTYGGATKHSWNDGNVTTPAECEKAGVKTYTCKADGCGATYTEDVNALGHNYGTWIDEVPAKCGVAGTKGHYTCSVCKKNFDTNKAELTDLTITALEHVWSDTYTSNGDGKDNTHYQTCTRENCGAKNEAVNHIWNDGEVTTPAECEKAGVKTYTCTADGCGATYTEDVNALGHNYGTWIDEVPAKCGVAGTKGHYTCSVCKKNFDTNKAELTDLTITALEHVWSDTYTSNGDGKDNTHYQTCTRENCGAKNEAVNHTWNDGNVTTPAECEKAGVKTYTCTADGCGATYTEDVNALGHNYGTWIDEVPAKCGVAGTKGHYTCSVCKKNFDTNKAELTDLTITALEHDYTGDIRNDGNTKDGTHSYLCKNGCGTYGGTTKHSWNDGTVTTPAECEKAGVKTYTCKADGCGATYTEDVNALGHNYDTTKSESNLTRPVKQADGTWSKGYYTHVCSHDASHTTKEYVDRANYTEYDKALADLNALLAADITDDAKAKINEAIDDSKVADNLITTEQDKINAATVKLEKAFNDNKGDLKSYTVTFVDGNGTTIKTESVISGGAATAPETATKAADATYHYTFSGWDKTFTNVTSALTVTATFTNAEHSFSTHTDKDDSVHTDKCACGYTVDVAHSYDDGEETTAPKCEEKGVKTYTCSLCGGTKTEDVAALGHKLNKTDAKAATCKDTGNQAYWTCSVCGDVFSDAEGTNKTTVAAMTTAKNPANHTGGTKTEKENTVPGTCKTAETWDDVTYCLGCSVKIGTEPKTGAIDPANHKNTESKPQQDATCTDAGYTAGTYCNDCETWVSGHETINALNHDYSGTPVLTRPVKQADGTWVDGYYTYTCKNDAAHTKTEPAERADYTAYDEAIKKLEDLLDQDINEEAKDAIKDALDEAKKLPDNLIDSEQSDVNKAVEDINKAIEDNKGALNFYTVTFVDGNGTTIKTESVISGGAATAPETVTKEADATYHYTFSGWDKTFTNVTSDLTVTAQFTGAKHDYKQEAHQEPKCTEDGYHIEKCGTCGKLKKSTIEASGHDYTETPVDATCKVKAHTHYQCNNCEYNYDGNYTGALAPHHWFVVDQGKEPTCSETGYTEHSECLVCGEEIKSVELPKLQHVDNDNNGKCDNCDGTMLDANHACGCICHKDSFIMRIIYAIANFFWRIFKINRKCSCGNVHYY